MAQIEYRISNTEHRMSKWAVALTRIPSEGLVEYTKNSGAQSLGHWTFLVGYWIFKRNGSKP